MNRNALLNLGTKYSILYAGLTVLVVFLGSQVFTYPFGLAALVMLLGSLVTAPLLFGTSDVGLDTVKAGGEAGFRTITNPSQYRSNTFSLPGKLQFALYLTGIAAYSAFGLVLVS